MVSHSRIAGMLKDMYGISISEGTCLQMIRRIAGRLDKVYAGIRELLVKGSVLNADETGLRVNGELQRMHSVSSGKLSYFSRHEKRGFAAMQDMDILPRFKGILSHDCWSPYFKLENVTHALCNAHLLRELVFIQEHEGQAWPARMKALILEMKEKRDFYAGQGSKELPRSVRDAFLEEFDAVTAEGMLENPPPDPSSGKRRGRGKTGALLHRLSKHRDSFCRFILDFRAPFDNSAAERDIRVEKVKQEVSGCMRTGNGADDFAAVLSCTYAARKNGMNIFSFLREAFLGLAPEFQPTE